MKDLSEIVVVMDISGSMNDSREGAIEGFNAFLAAQKADPQPANFSLIMFDHEYMPRFYSKPIGIVPALNDITYVPRGRTALADAIGRSITELGAKLQAMAESQRPSRVIFAILTDGMENASQEYTLQKCADMITHQQDVYSWQFFMLAADVRVLESPIAMAMPAANSGAYAASDVGTQVAFAAMNENVTRARRS